MIDAQTDDRAERINGRVPDIVTGALALHARGLDVVRLTPRSKRPIGDDWPATRYEDETAIVEAFGDNENVGVLLGGGIADVDLDSPEALRLAAHLLPATESVHGRASARASHRWYSYPETATLPTRRYRDPTGAVLLELRADRTDGRRGLQTMAPPSTHPDGEALVWEIDGDPGEVAPHDLIDACDELAAAVLICRSWPRDHGGRHDLALAIGGMLARGGCDLARACRVVEAALRHGGVDPEWSDRVAAVRDSYAALARGERVTGTPTVARTLGDAVTRTLREWLRLATATEEGEGEDRPRFRLLSDSEIESRTPPDMQVEGIIPANSLGVLYGPPGAGKTFAAIYLAIALQTGRDFCGHRTRQGRICYVIAEGSAAFGRRIAARKAWDRIEGDSGALWLPEPVQLYEPGDVLGLLDAIEAADAGPLGLVVFDTLARCAVGAEENSASDTARLIAGCDRIRRTTGATVLLVHHPDKLGIRERGSSAIKGAADVMISCAADGELVTLKCEKSKDSAPFGDLYLRQRIIEFEDGSTSVALDPVEKDEATARPASRDMLRGAARQAYDALAEHFGAAGATATEWQLSSGLQSSTFFKARVSLVEKWGFVAKNGHRYQIAE